MEATIAETLGSLTSIILWLVLVGISLYKSIKKKQTVWIVVLIINFIVGWFLPTWIVMILPIVYLIVLIYKKKKEK